MFLSRRHILVFEERSTGSCKADNQRRDGVAIAWFQSLWSKSGSSCAFLHLNRKLSWPNGRSGTPVSIWWWIPWWARWWWRGTRRGESGRHGCWKQRWALATTMRGFGMLQQARCSPMAGSPGWCLFNPMSPLSQLMVTIFIFTAGWCHEPSLWSLFSLPV